MIPILNEHYFRYYGRILKKDSIAYLGYTNSQTDFYVKGSANDTCTVTAVIGTKLNGEVNDARLRVYLDDVLITREPIVLDQELNTYTLVTIKDNLVHKVSLIKITEAAMSYAALHSINVENGELLPFPEKEDKRIKAEFIGDSITCGYGVHGAPESEYHIREEDGMAAYSYLTAKELNLNARYFSVSGYGVYCEYTGNTENVVPRVYNYTNWWVDPDIKYDFSEFIPELIVINLGTNDSGHLCKKGIPEKFVASYTAYLKALRSHYPEAKILCICGTLCTEAFEYIQKACDIVTADGMKDIYTMELPYHDVEHDGKASEHPSAVTHQKDADRLVQKIKEIMPEVSSTNCIS